jgi:hypothetical protein
VTNRYVGIPYNYLTIELYENPDATIAKHRKNLEVRAWVCADCGYTEFYVAEPESLRSLVQRSKANRKG